MACVAIDDDGNERVVNVVIGEEPEDIRLACNADGETLVYDEHMELLDPAAAQAGASTGSRVKPMSGKRMRHSPSRAVR